MIDWLKHQAVKAAQPYRKRIIVETKVEPHRFEFKMGDRVHFLEADRDLPEFETFDFAAIIIAALAIRRGVPVQFDLPVSEGMAITLARISVLWSVRFPSTSHPLDLELTNIVPDPTTPRTGGILCLSGGVDSTHAAIEASQDKGYTHGMVLHGLDFALDNPQGFGGRMAKISEIADHFGLDPIIVRTNIRKSLRAREAYYTLLLYSCLHFAGNSLARCGFAADQTIPESMLSTTASNVPGIDGFLGTPTLPFDHFGREPDRFEKIKVLYDRDPKLVSLLGFCFFDPVDGGNCGECEKCMRARFALDLNGMSQTLLFADTRDPVAFYENHTDNKRTTLLLTLYRLEGLALRTQPGPERDRMIVLKNSVLGPER
ncbi:MAG: hypothetical protein GKR99_02910 [Rhodobacteraceae bacterium]|nr:hypothetical protein [Paracoccaceae bacterium]